MAELVMDCQQLCQVTGWLLILLIDDDVDIRRLLQAHFGYLRLFRCWCLCCFHFPR
jgi:hypothetical protein